MNRYQTSTPRTAIGLIAMAMTALTLALAVVLPAGLPSGTQDTGLVLAGPSAAPVPAAPDVIVRRAPG